MATHNKEQGPFVDCPLNPTHKCKLRRLSIHMSKCKKNNPVKVPCPFSASHFVNARDLRSHSLTCPERPEPMMPTGPVPNDLPPPSHTRPLHVLREQQHRESMAHNRPSVSAGLRTVVRADGSLPPASSSPVQLATAVQEQREDTPGPSFFVGPCPVARETGVQHGRPTQSWDLRLPAVAVQEALPQEPFQSIVTPRLWSPVCDVRSSACSRDGACMSGDVVMTLASRIAALGREKAMPESDRQEHF
ncbi:uncharacterized protein LOC144105348 [Amblyomma americanum]